MTTDNTPALVDAQALRDALACGRTGVVDQIDFHLARARAVEPVLQAFASLDERVIRLQAESLQAARARGGPMPPLFGVPVAIKDIIDTIDFPTACGSPIHAGRYAAADATVVRRLRDAGALIFGKTVTTEFATTEFATATPGPTRNPHNPEHTPGGSSSGSAAAVAAGVVPLAVGTQTKGSVLRPASFCGVYGFKPSMGLLPRTGVFEQSPSLDHVGVFARCVEDLAWAAEVMSGDDGVDPATRGVAPKQLLAVCRSEPPVTPRFCFVKTPWWGQVDEEAQAAFEAFIELMDGVVTRAELPPIVEKTVQWISTVNEAELAFALQHEYLHHAEALSPTLRQRVELGSLIPVGEYLAAKARMPQVACAFDAYFEKYDAILCPSALGAAPKGFASTGNPIMQTVWSFGGLPAVSLPLLNLSGGMPLGVQAVAGRHDDARLLRSARWLVQEFVKRSPA